MSLFLLQEVEVGNMDLSCLTLLKDHGQQSDNIT